MPHSVCMRWNCLTLSNVPNQPHGPWRGKCRDRRCSRCRAGLTTSLESCLRVAGAQSSGELRGRTSRHRSFCAAPTGPHMRGAKRCARCARCPGQSCRMDPGCARRPTSPRRSGNGGLDKLIPTDAVANPPRAQRRTRPARSSEPAPHVPGLSQSVAARCPPWRRRTSPCARAPGPSVPTTRAARDRPACDSAAR